MSMPSSNEQAAAEFMQDELRRLHEEYHPQRRSGEFTICEYGQAQDPPLDERTAQNNLSYYTRIGRVIRVKDKRFIDGRLRTVYKLVTV